MADLDVAVVGAGAAGLGVAHALRRAGRSVHVFEAADGVGGRMRTLRRDGYLIDEGAEMISVRGYDETWRLIRETGVPAAEITRIARPFALWRHGRAHPNLAHPRGLLTGAGLSLRGRVDLIRLTARLRPASSFDPDWPENTPLGTGTLAELAARYGPELRDNLLAPMADGFYGWDPARSAAAPYAAQMASTGTARDWRTYRSGMDTLARRLAGRLAVSTGTPVREVVSGPGGARLTAGDSVLTARSVVLAVPAPAALALHVNAPEADRPYLAACGFVPRMRVSCLTGRPLQFPSGPPLHVLVLPAREGSALVTVHLEHNKCAGRAPAGRGLVTMLVSQAAVGDLIGAGDETVIETCAGQAERYLPGLRAATTATVVHRFRHGMPEATPAALALRGEFARRPPGVVEYAGDWVLLRPCGEGAFRSARITADRVLAARRPPVSRPSKDQDFYPERITASPPAPTDSGPAVADVTGADIAGADRAVANPVVANPVVTDLPVAGSAGAEVADAEVAGSAAVGADGGQR
jgi:oxygen-dependent protoporphyrinogen oxidase